MTIVTEPDDYSADIHEPDATGFPDGEGEVVDASYFVEEPVYTGAEAREKSNEWDEAIREAAKWIVTGKPVASGS